MNHPSVLPLNVVCVCVRVCVGVCVEGEGRGVVVFDCSLFLYVDVSALFLSLKKNLCGVNCC